MVRFWILSVAFALGLVGSTIAQDTNGQDFDPEEFEAFTADIMTANDVPGLAAVIFNDSGIMYEKAFGVADDEGRAVTLDTPFQLGSISKPFASLILVQLAAEGRLNLDAPIVDYMPEFRTSDKNASDLITTRQILSHRSGFSTLDGNRIQNQTYRGEDALTIAVENLAKAKLESPPGQQTQYSNANYMIAALLIETLTGESYEINVEDRIFIPLDMNRSYIQMPYDEDLGEATGFRQWFGKARPKRFISGRAMMAAGGVTSSARDLTKFMSAVAAGDPRIIPPQYKDDLFKPHGGLPGSSVKYGLGWMLFDTDNDRVIFHSGLNGGFASQAAFFESSGRGAVVLTNMSGFLAPDIPGAVVRKGLGMPPGATRSSTGQKATVWGSLATVVALLLGGLLSCYRFAGHMSQGHHVSKLRAGLPALVLVGLGLGLIRFVPAMNGITFSGLKVFFPDIWLCIGLSALVCFVWAAGRLIIYAAKNPDKA